MAAKLPNLRGRQVAAAIVAPGAFGAAAKEASNDNRDSGYASEGQGSRRQVPERAKQARRASGTSVSSALSHTHQKKRTKMEAASYHETVESFKQRAVVVRAVYSKARSCIQAQRPSADSEGSERASVKKLTFKAAAGAIKEASRDTVLSRNTVGVFVAASFDAKERARLESEVQKLELEAEKMMANNDEGGLMGRAAWLSSLLGEVEQLRAQKPSDNVEDQSKTDELFSDLKEVTAKMQALKDAYSRKLQDLDALRSHIDTAVTDVHSKLTVFNKSMGSLAENMPSMCASAVADLQGGSAQSPGGPPEFGLAPSPANSSDLASAESSPGNSVARRGLWRKVAICLSFQKLLLGGTTKFLRDAVHDVSQAAIANGHGPPEALGVIEELPETGEAHTPQGSRPASKCAFLLNAAESNGMGSSCLGLLGDVDAEPGDSCHSACRRTLVSTADPPIGDEEVVRQPRRPYPRLALAPAAHSSIGEKELVLPPCVEQLLLQACVPDLEKRLRCPYVMLPLVPARERMRNVGKARTLSRTLLKRQELCNFTLEAVLREREARGLRTPGADD